ncbi:hypothetical protein E4U59_006013 [Claviceps monticola]|nr:hypothetical protein E4U59_006013 [Claviceps monticola]
MQHDLHRCHVRRRLRGRQSSQEARTPSRHSAGPPRAESVAVRSIQRSPTRPNIRSAFLTRDDVRGGRLQYHRPGPRSGESLSQTAARKEHEQRRCDHRPLKRAVQRDPDAQLPSLTPTIGELYARVAASPMLRQLYARSNQFTASQTLRQSGGPDPDDIFAPTSAQPRESIAPSARSGQYRAPIASDESAGPRLVRRHRQDQGCHFVEALAKL